MVRTVIVASVAAAGFAYAAPAFAGGDSISASPVFVVNDAGDGTGCDASTCTLRGAIAAANVAGGSIEFNLGQTPSTILLGSLLPTIGKAVSIDGYTQAGSSPNSNALAGGDNAVVLVKLAPTPNFFGDGLTFGTGADGSSVHGLAFTGFDHAISVAGANNVTIAGNLIGTADGTSPFSFTNRSGIYVAGGAGSTIGGPNPADRNLISNNGGPVPQTGIDLNGASGALVQGNYIGTDKTGKAALPNDDGVAIFGGSSNNVVSGNVISGNAGSGVDISDAGTAGNSVVLNLIGVAADGSTPLGNATGVIVQPGGSGNAIGGPLGGNTISGNTGDGIDAGGSGSATVIQGNTVTGNGNNGIFVGNDLTHNKAFGDAPGIVISGNRVAGNGTNALNGIGIYVDGVPGPATITGNIAGLDASGTVAEANTGDGIRVEGSSGVVVGGTSAADRNVASGNVGHGIHLFAGSSNDTVEGNYAGVNVNGTASIPNGVDGIAVDTSSNNTIGGSAPGAGNLASGNANQGISVFTFDIDAPADNNVVQGNTVGLNAAGTAPIPNGNEGIRLFEASSTTVGGIAPGEANIVKGNTAAGVTVYQPAIDNSIRGNQIDGNGGLGIDLDPIGVTADDAGDDDSGANNLQNFPVLKSATVANGSTRITGALSSSPGSYTIDFYASPACDASGNGEGAVWLGKTTVDVSETSASFDTGTGTDTIAAAGGDNAITATATDSEGNTSEFSSCVSAAAPKAGLSLTADEASVPAGAANVPLSSVPAAVLGQFAFAPVPNSPVPNSAVGAAPVPNSPVPNSPVPNSPVPNSPVPNSPVANSGFDGISQDDLSRILLSSIPIDWSTIFVGTDPNAGVPVTGLTLADVYNDPPALTRFEQLKLGQLQLGSSLLRGIRLESILFGGTKLQFIPPYDQSDWCALLSSCTNVDVAKTTVLGLDVAGLLSDTVLGKLGKVTVGQITDPVAPVPNSPVPNSPVPNSPVPNSPVPNSALTLTAIGGVVIGSLYDPSLVVDCSKFTSTTVCLTKTLADAAALNAIKSTATFADIMAPKSAGGPSPLADTNFNEFAIAMVGLENLPWESWPFDGFQAFAGTGDVVHYHLTAPVPCSSDYSLRVILPHGFLVKTGTSSIVVGTGSRQAVGDPSQDASTGATWDTTHQGLPQASNCTGTQPAGLDFQALAGFRIGSQQTATAKLTVGATVNNAVDQAPVTVTQNGEPDDNPASAPAIQPNTLAIGHIASSDDLDWRSFSTTGLPAGTKITVYLRPPSGTDLDLFLTKPGALSLLSGPSAPVPNSPVPNSPVPNSPVPNSGDTLNRTSDNPQPEGLQDAPVPNSDIASAGITRGDAVEVAQVTLSGDESAAVIGIAVDGYNGAHSNDAYTLRVQVTKPPQLPACPARTYANPSATVGTMPAPAADTQTLFLFNYEDTGRTYGQSAADALKARLDAFVAAHSDLHAAVLPVDGNAAVHAAKAAWDAAPCSIPAANDVVRKINALVALYRQTATHVQNIVIVGGDELIPMARVQDATTDANESTASGDLLFTTNGDTRGNALFASEFLGNVLTDDAYAAGATIPWFGGELDLPSLAVGRLVETPAEITKQLDAYDASDGVLDPSNADGVLQPTDGVVTGYDFMSDEAAQIQTELASRLTPPLLPLLLNDSSWNAASIAPAFANTAGNSEVLSVNAHYNHWELAPALPNPFTQAGLVRDTVLPVSPATTQLQNAILFTMGCHGGLNVSDTFPVDASKQEQLRDWAQALAQNGAGVYVANTGYGYGDYDAIALSEQLMTMFAHNLASDGTIGRKLMLAKQQFFGTIGTADPYAAKALQEATFYGLPFYAIGSRNEAGPTSPVTTSVDADTGLAAASVAWPTDFNTTLVPHNTARGTYFSTAAQGVEYVDGRPIEPRADKEVTANGLTAHGVLINSLTTHDESVDPLIASPMIDNAAHEQELKVTNATFPATFASIGHWNALGANHDELVFVPGQTRDGNVQRLVDAAGLQVLYSPSNNTDFTAPAFSQVGSIVNGDGTATIFAKVSDAGTIPLVKAFFTQGGGGWTFVGLTFDSASGYWTGTATGITVPTIEAAFEAVDGAGNVGFTTDKGHLFQSLSGDHTGPEISVAAPIANGAIGLNQSVPASFTCSDDGGVASCKAQNDGVDINNAANVVSAPYGPHTLTVTATDLSGNTTTVTVTYTVGFRFSGFFQPVDNPPILNVVKAGSGVPVKFSLGGNQGLSIFTTGSPSSTAIGCDNAAPTSDVDTTGTTTQSGFSYDPKSGQYTYVWNTSKSWAGTCRRLNVTLADMTVHPANFKFK